MEASKELFDEIEAHLLSDEKPSDYLQGLFSRAEFREYPFSLLRDLRNTEQSPVHHPEGNVWNHTLLVVDEAAKHRSESKDAKVFMWAALLHDIGKPATTARRKGKITSYNHDKVGAKLARDFLTVFSKDARFIDGVCSLVLYHMHVLYVLKGLPYADVPGMKAQGDIREIALLGLCDRLGRIGYDREAEEKNIRLFLSKME